MAAIKHPQSRKPKKSSSRKAGPPDEVAALRAQMEAAVDDYDETIRLAKLWLKAVKRNPPNVAPGEAWWEKAIARAERIPPEDLARLPTDGARNLDHYLYGSPKKPEAE